MVLVNTDYISGKELEMLGMVKGSTIQCKNIGRDIGASFKNLVGGEMKAYTEMKNMGFFEWNLSFKKHVKNLIHNIRQVRLLPDRYGS